MKNQITDCIVTPVVLSNDVKEKIIKAVKSRQTKIIPAEWERLFQFLEPLIETHNSIQDYSNQEDGLTPSVRKAELLKIATHLKKSLAILSSLDESNHDLLAQHYYLSNYEWLPGDGHRSGLSSYESALTKLARGVVSSSDRIRVSTGRNHDDRYSWFIIELADFLENNHYDIKPSKASETVFYRLVLALLNGPLEANIIDPSRIIERALNLRDKTP